MRGVYGQPSHGARRVHDSRLRAAVHRAREDLREGERRRGFGPEQSARDACMRGDLSDATLQERRFEASGQSKGRDLLHIDDVMRLFKFRHMPVTDNGRLTGLVTHRDVLRVSASSLLPAAREQTELLATRYRVRDVMTRTPKSVSAETRLVDAARLMQHEKLGCLPVVNADNVVVGILTEADFLRLAVDLLEEPASA